MDVKEDYPVAVAAAGLLYQDLVLDHFAEQKCEIKEVFNTVCEYIDRIDEKILYDIGY